MARIVPSDDTPGAREAGCVDFLDRYLSGLGYIFAKPDGSGFEVLEGRGAEAWMQRIETMRARYVKGIQDLDTRAHAHFSADFVSLTPEQQDGVLRAVETSGTGEPTTLTPSDALAGPVSAQPALQQTSTEVELGFLPVARSPHAPGLLRGPDLRRKQGADWLEGYRLPRSRPR